MFQIDIRTVYLGYIIINIVNLIVIGALYFQIKNRFPGTFLLLLSFIMSATGNILVFFRGFVPDWISISVSNTLIVSSTVILLIAFEKFVNKKGIQIQNYLLIVVFGLVHTYFAFIDPNLVARNINFSVAYLFLSFQIAFLLLRRTPAMMRKITRPVGIVFCAVFIIQLFRIFNSIQNHHETIDYFKSASSESVFVLLWEIILILLAFSITLMYNKSLIMQVNAQEEKFSKSFHAAPFIIMLSKFSDGKIFEVNKKVQSISGYEPKEIIGLNTSQLNIWNHENDRIAFITDIKSEGGVTEREYVFRKKSGDYFTGLIAANTININNEQCIISVITDITERKEMEMQLTKNEMRLRELNSTKDKFFSIIAHDLKSPFNGIVGFSDILHEQVLNQDYRGIADYAEIISKSAHQAMNLLTNLMEWSRSQTGQMNFNPEYVDIVVLIHSCFELLKLSARQKSITITFNLPHNLIVRADKAMLETVVRNLMSNAIKFTPREGEVSIVAEERQKECLVVVSDNGMGIEKNNLKKLFRIDGDFSSMGTENETGTGLGLIICKDFIEKHHGKIWVESELRVGSKFYFLLPKL
jgi:PAS domain S-box-containing protein